MTTSTACSKSSALNLIKRAACLVALCLLAASSGCSRMLPENGPAITASGLDADTLSADLLLKEVSDFVALGPRDPGTPGAENAALYLADRLRSMGLQPEIDTFEDATPAGPRTFRNVIAKFAGTSPGLIVLISHYDTKAGISPSFAGANDSGSSTGLLLVLAQLLKDNPRSGPEIWLAFVDGEECLEHYRDNDGLHGSRRLAASLQASPGLRDRLRAVIVVDMVGDKDLHLSIPRNCSPELTALAFDTARAIGMRDRISLFRSAIIDDHLPFHELGMPAIDLIDFHFGSEPGLNDFWHTPEDTMDKISGESLLQTGRLVIAMINRLSR